MAAAEQISSSSRNHLFQRKEIHKAETKGDFTVAIYNVLADFHIPKNREHTKIYQYCPTEDLYKRPLGINSNRHALLMEEIKYLSSDIICFQEIDKWYQEAMSQELGKLGYSHDFQLKEKGTLEGVLTAVRKDVFETKSSHRLILNDLMYEKAAQVLKTGDKLKLERLERDTVAILTHLVHLSSRREVILCNFHAYYQVDSPDIGTLQACLLADKLADYRNGLSENPDVSVIFCGDFNSEPGQHAYNVVVNQKLTNEEAEKLGKIYYAIDPETKFSEEKEKERNENAAASMFKDAFYHGLPLKSAYKEILGKEPDVTSSDGVHMGTFDYIFYSSGLKPCSVLAPFTKEELSPGGPSKIFPSDHTSLKAEFKFL